MSRVRIPSPAPKEDLMTVDFLPDPSITSYGYAKLSDPTLTWENYDKFKKIYNEDDLLRFRSIIFDNKKLIENKKVLEIGCHLGYLSLYCLHNGAAYVKGTNVRDRELNIAKELCSIAGYNNYEFIHSNLYNLQELKDLCDWADTILLSGVLYHVNNHVQLMQTIASSAAYNIIIESAIINDANMMPATYWRLENSAESSQGMELDEKIKNIVVGIPNRSFIERSLEFGGYKIIYNKQFDFVPEDEGKVRITAVLSGQKNIRT
jgi:SAM-dependent methyltransferase